jgi:Predicted membrane protein (DUF2306)
MNISAVQPTVQAVAASEPRHSDRWLPTTVKLWFAAAAVGQLLFVVYVLVFYGAAAMQDNFAGLAKHKMLLKGHVAADATGNAMLVLHALLAALILCSGLLQLVGAIRQRWPAVHRWSGRVFLLSVFIGSASGLYLTWVRATNPTLLGGIAISVNALLIGVFGMLAWRAARSRDFRAHRVWALRAFIVACGVWFQRVGYLAWFMVMQGPVGVTKRLDGLFDIFWSFACYLLPLALLELYLRAQASGDHRRQRVAAVVIGVFTLLMAVGSAGAAVLLWYPLARIA